MRQFVAYLVPVLLNCLSPGPGSVIVISGQEQKTSTKVLEESDDCQCASAEERERARNEIHQIANSAILATTGHIYRYTCNGTPGWRCVAFMNIKSQEPTHDHITFIIADQHRPNIVILLSGIKPILLIFYSAQPLEL